MPEVKIQVNRSYHRLRATVGERTTNSWMVLILMEEDEF